MGYVKADNLSVGDEVILSHDFMAMAGGFTKGSRVRITGYDNTRGFSVEDEFGNRVIEMGWNIGKKVQ